MLLKYWLLLAVAVAEVLVVVAVARVVLHTRPVVQLHPALHIPSR
jgi:hypothetical protein